MKLIKVAALLYVLAFVCITPFSKKKITPPSPARKIELKDTLTREKREALYELK